ncbi:hypothetical protein SAMN05216405_4552 [Lachnospiraceae bacterium NLAE-zl-G231]|nr:hypothetical protein SAMN05216405_4552 [Lachnospiraceae bacterium NLAE-zl-G231]
MGSSFSTKFERKFGKYAIPNISLYLIICYAVGYLISLIYPAFLGYLTLDPFEIFLHGQVWRLFTWILIPPSSSNLFFTLIMLVFYYSIGTQLERTWGTYRYNLYLFLGMIFTIAGSIILFLYCLLLGAQPLALGTETIYSLSNGIHVYFGSFSTYYINMSIFLAYAATFPEMQVLLMFIIPIKVKWLGIVYGAMLVFECLTGGMVTWFVIGSSLLNFVVFFLTSRNHIRMSPKQMKRRHDFKKQTHAPSGITKHKCAICGRTEKDDPTLEFRFCSKCYGNYEYCQYHLYTHEHIKPPHEAGRY